MRKLAKAPEPQVLVENAVDWTQRLLDAIARGVDYSAIERNYGHKDVRSALRDETSRKCAYCESHMEAVSYPHVEHIKPKSVYRELTFAWQNLSVACQACNTNKGDRDPTGNNFVHPYVDDPSDRFGFVGPLMITRRPGDLAATNMINWLDLNRTPLVLSRIQVADRVHQIYLEAITLPLEARQEFLELSIAPLIRGDANYSRVAECMVAFCTNEYSQQLAN